MNPHDCLKAIIRTEKFAAQDGKYLFIVNPKANKIQIKKAVEDIYKVKVSCVNTFINPGKLKRVRYQAGYTSDTKKAVVTLKEGEKIEFA